MSETANITNVTLAV